MRDFSVDGAGGKRDSACATSGWTTHEASAAAAQKRSAQRRRLIPLITALHRLSPGRNEAFPDRDLDGNFPAAESRQELPWLSILRIGL
jgi:hypothetical protein